LNGLYRKLNDMQFDFDLVGESPVIEESNNLRDSP